MYKQSKVIVTGGSGFIGSYIVRNLLQQGYNDILCFKRPTSDLALLGEAAQSARWQDVDLLDVCTLQDHLKDAQVIIHAAALVSFAPADKAELLKFNVQGTANLVNVALDCDIKKFIHISSIASLSRSADQSLITESTETDGVKVLSPYAISKYKSEIEVWRAGGEGLPIAILNPSVVVGSGFWSRGSASFFRQVLGGMPFYPQGSTGFVDVRDVAKAVILLLESDIEQQRFLISSENRSYLDVLSQIAWQLDVKPPSIRLNPFLNELAFMASKIGSLFSSDAKVITRGSLRNASKNYLFDNRKSVAKLGMRYIPIEQTIAATCQQLKIAAKNAFQPAYLPSNDHLQ